MAKQEVEVKVVIDGELKGTEKFWICSKADLGDKPKDIILECIVSKDGNMLYESLTIYLDDMGMWFEEHLDELHSTEIIYLVKFENDTILYECRLECYSVRVIDNNIKFNYAISEPISVKEDNSARYLLRYLMA